MKTLAYRPTGVCASEIRVCHNNDHIVSVEFKGGCHGNAQGMAQLLKGMSCDEAASKLDGITCGRKGTSCPDQLAQALRKRNDP